jgi:hypothetical protein
MDIRRQRKAPFEANARIHLSDDKGYDDSKRG